MSPVPISTHSGNQCTGDGEEYTEMSFNPDANTNQDHRHESQIDSSSGTDDEGYTFMYRGQVKEGGTEEVGGKEQESDNVFPTTYDKCDFGPRYHPKSMDEGE